MFQLDKSQAARVYCFETMDVYYRVRLKNIKWLVNC